MPGSRCYNRLHATIRARRMSTTETSQIDLPCTAAVADAARMAGLTVDPSELHGALCGYLCGGGYCDADDWIGRLALDGERAPAAGDALDRLRASTTAQLDAQDFGMELLLPADDAPLAERADGLVAWCRGFLGGFGLAAPESAALSDEASEALQDLANIAASDLAYDGSEADEGALAEVVEFVRIAALMLHGDCVHGTHRQGRVH